MAPACSGPAWVAPLLSVKPDKPAELTVASDPEKASADRESSFLPQPVKPGKWGVCRVPKWSLILPVNQPAIFVPCLPEPPRHWSFSLSLRRQLPYRQNPCCYFLSPVIKYKATKIRATMKTRVHRTGCLIAGEGRPWGKWESRWGLSGFIYARRGQKQRH